MGPILIQLITKTVKETMRQLCYVLLQAINACKVPYLTFISLSFFTCVASQCLIMCDITATTTTTPTPTPPRFLKIG